MTFGINICRHVAANELHESDRPASQCQAHGRPQQVGQHKTHQRCQRRRKGTKQRKNHSNDEDSHPRYCFHSHNYITNSSSKLICSFLNKLIFQNSLKAIVIHCSLILKILNQTVKHSTIFSASEKMNSYKRSPINSVKI